MEEFQERVLVEKSELDSKVQKLIDFMEEDVYVKLTPVDRGLLMLQLAWMQTYSDVLGRRIKRF